MTTLALNILDIVQNSIRAKADEIRIAVSESLKEDLMKISILDNGLGIPASILKNVTDPFVTTRKTRKTGLGLSLLKQHAAITGGDITVESEEGKGTKVSAFLGLSHIDRQPLGDIAGVLIILIASNPGIDFIYDHKTDYGEFHFSVRETCEYLGVRNLSDNGLLSGIREMIINNLGEIRVSA
jgi:signal transduction histidine kinase